MLYGATEKTQVEISQKLSDILASRGVAVDTGEDMPTGGNGSSLAGATEKTLLEISRKLSKIQENGSGNPATPEKVTPLVERAESAAAVAEEAQNAVVTLQAELENDYPEVPALKTQVGEVKEKLSDLRLSAFEYGDASFKVNHLPNVSEYINYSGSASQTGSLGKIIRLSDTSKNATKYDSFAFVTPYDMSVYVDGVDNVSYYAITIGTNPTDGWSTDSVGLYHKVSSAVRYRKSENNLPSKDNVLSIAKGTLIVFSFVKGEIGDLVICDRAMGLNRNISVDASQIVNVVKDEPLHFEKYSNLTYYISNEKYKFALQKQSNPSKNLVNWNITHIDCGSNVIVPVGTDIIGPVLEYGMEDFVGGVHGNETAADIVILQDGAVWDGTSDFDANRIDVYLKSKVHRYSDHSDLYDRIVHLSFTKDCLDVEQSYSCLQTSNVSKFCSSGLLGILKNDVVYMATSKDMIGSTLNNATVKSRDVTNILMSWNKGEFFGCIDISAIRGTESPNFVGYITPLDDRFKAYMLQEYAQPLTMAIGDTLHGSCKYTFA